MAHLLPLALLHEFLAHRDLRQVDSPLQFPAAQELEVIAMEEETEVEEEARQVARLSWLGCWLVEFRSCERRVVA